MKRAIWVGCLVGSTALGACASNDTATESDATVNVVGADEMFERLKSLEGRWQHAPREAVAEGDFEARANAPVVYEVTSAGTAVVETTFAGEPHEMRTVYYVDGGRLKLTHYCAMGNQPHMLADPITSADEVSFTCVGAGNTETHDDAHMHWARIRFLDDGDVEARWTMADKGEPGSAANLHLRRSDR